MATHGNLEDQDCMQVFSLTEHIKPPETAFGNSLMESIEPATNSEETHYSNINQQMSRYAGRRKNKTNGVNNEDDEEEQYECLYKADMSCNPQLKESMDQDYYDYQKPPQQRTDAAGHTSNLHKRTREEQKDRNELIKEISRLKKRLSEKELDRKKKTVSCKRISMYMLICVVSVALLIILAIDMKNPFSGNKLTVFVTGKAGSGKTSLIYGLLGVDREEMDRKRKIGAETLQTGYVTRNGVEAIILEKRSLEHDDFGLDSTEVYQVKNVDLVLYTLRMDDSECRPSHKTGLQKLGRHFGTNIWNKTVIALTFANRVDYVNNEGNLKTSKEYLEERKFYWIRCIHEVFFEEKVPEIICKEIPIVPVGYYTKPNVLGDSWIDVLTRSILSRLADSRAQNNLKLAFNITN